MNLKEKRIAIIINGVRTEYKSVKEASEKTGIAYATLMNWIKKRNRSRNDIIIEDISDLRKTGIVYRYYDKQNKSYVGSTVQDMFTRDRIHMKGTTPFDIYYQQHPDDFEIEILEDNIPEDDLLDYEAMYIIKFDSINNGYNVRLPNQYNHLGVSVYDNGKIRYFDSMFKCAKYYNIPFLRLNDYIKGRKKPDNNRIFKTYYITGEEKLLREALKIETDGKDAETK